MKTKRFVLGITTLAVASTPLFASAAVQTANTTINATVADVITISTPATVTISLTPTAGGVVSSSSDTVTVNTNRTTGYNLKLADNDATVNLASGGNNITAHTGTAAAPTALATGTWGYAVAGAPFDASYTAESNNGASASKWAGVPVNASPATIKTTGTTATNDTTTIWYAAKVNSSQPGGTYSDTIVYTATTN